MPDILAEAEIGHVADLAGLEEIESEWRDLWWQTPGSSPFQTPEWLIAWWRCFGGQNLWCVTLRTQGRLVGLLPLFLWYHPESKERQFLFLGTGISDYGDGLFHPEVGWRGVQRAFEYLDENRSVWDACDFQQIRSGSLLFESALPENWTEEVELQEICPRLNLEEEDYVAKAMMDHYSEKLNRYHRRAAKMGRVSFKRVDAGSFESWYEGLLRLHGARWNSLGETGMLAQPQLQQFNRAAARRLLELGIARFYGFYVNERMAACYYGFLHRGRASAYLTGFDPEFDHLSAGALMMEHAIREAKREGAREFDFLRGQEPYKYRWGATDFFNYRRRLLHGEKQKPG